MSITYIRDDGVFEAIADFSRFGQAPPSRRRSKHGVSGLDVGEEVDSYDHKFVDAAIETAKRRGWKVHVWRVKGGHFRAKRLL